MPDTLAVGVVLGQGDTLRDTNIVREGEAERVPVGERDTANDALGDPELLEHCELLSDADAVRQAVDEREGLLVIELHADSELVTEDDLECELEADGETTAVDDWGMHERRNTRP